MSSSTCCNTATGYNALKGDTSGSGNTADGDVALSSNTTGSENTASCLSAMSTNVSGNNNVAVGYCALTGLNTTMSNNVAIGALAMHADSGTNNIGIGYSSGPSSGCSGANNIWIGNSGITSGCGTNGVIFIGNQGTQTQATIAGLYGASNPLAQLPVTINSLGELSAQTSSRRFKEDIQDMGDASSDLLRLRPVTFRRKDANPDGSKPLDYGLIAEEVADVYPDLAARGQDGQIDGVQYQKLAPMILNEVQKQAETIRSLEERLAALEALLSRPPANR